MNVLQAAEAVSLEPLLERVGPGLLVLLIVVERVAQIIRAHLANKSKADTTGPCPAMEDHSASLLKLETVLEALAKAHDRTTADGVPMWWFTEGDRKALHRSEELLERLREGQAERAAEAGRFREEFSRAMAESAERGGRVEQALQNLGG